MRTVKWVREELAKFPDDALCYAYEGEVTGIVIIRDQSPGRRWESGCIHLSEGADTRETELLPPPSTPEGRT